MTLKRYKLKTNFRSFFSTIVSLVEFVGENKLHLRRVCAIRQKAHYKNAAFMERLRSRHNQYGVKKPVSLDAEQPK
jgi:hypothetical protein